VSSESAYRPVTLTPLALQDLAGRAARGEVTLWRGFSHDVGDHSLRWASGDPLVRTDAGRVVISSWADPWVESFLDASDTISMQREWGHPFYDYSIGRGWTGTQASLLVECECACGCDWAGRFDEGVLGEGLVRCQPCSAAHPPLLRTTSGP